MKSYEHLVGEIKNLQRFIDRGDDFEQAAAAAAAYALQWAMTDNPDVVAPSITIEGALETRLHKEREDKRKQQQGGPTP